MSRHETFRSTTRAAWLPAVLCTLVAFAQVFLSGNNGCGTKAQNETLHSPVQALGTVYKQPGGTVLAELVLITTIDSSHAFIDSASGVKLLVDGTEIVLPKDATRPGRWAITSQEEPRLVQVAGTDYLFKFHLDDAAVAGDEAGKDFAGEVAANGTASLVQPVSIRPRDYPQDVTFVPAIPNDKRGILQVYGPDDKLVYSNWDVAQPQFDGSKHAALTTGSKYTLPGSAFTTSGDYRIVLYTMSYVAGFDPHKSAELGLFTGFMAGPASEVSLAVP